MVGGSGTADAGPHGKVLAFGATARICDGPGTNPELPGCRQLEAPPLPGDTMTPPAPGDTGQPTAFTASRPRT